VSAAALDRTIKEHEAACAPPNTSGSFTQVVPLKDFVGFKVPLEWNLLYSRRKRRWNMHVMLRHREADTLRSWFECLAGDRSSESTQQNGAIRICATCLLHVNRLSSHLLE
jgi:hypothetical protein